MGWSTFKLIFSKITNLNIPLTLLGWHCLRDKINCYYWFQQLVAGSGASPEKDEELNAPREERDESIVDGTEATGPSDNSEDNYSAGIPGPLTRLFVLANRGLSNLIQDLILVSALYRLI